MIFNKLHKRLDKIEENQSRVSEVLDKIQPMVEEYHAAKLMRKKWSERVTFYSKTLAIFTGIMIIIKTVIAKVF